MDRTTLFCMLGGLLLLLMVFNAVRQHTNQSDNANATSANATRTSEPKRPDCSQTTFGCCPDGINSKINSVGTNCPSYHPDPGYPITPTPLTPSNPVTTGQPAYIVPVHVV